MYYLWSKQLTVDVTITAQPHPQAAEGTSCSHSSKEENTGVRWLILPGTFPVNCSGNLCHWTNYNLSSSRQQRNKIRAYKKQQQQKRKSKNQNGAMFFTVWDSKHKVLPIWFFFHEMKVSQYMCARLQMLKKKNLLLSLRYDFAFFIWSWHFFFFFFWLLYNKWSL